MNKYPQIRIFIYTLEDGYMTFTGSELLLTENEGYFLDSVECDLEDITEEEFNAFITKWENHAKVCNFSFILTEDVQELKNEYESYVIQD